MCDDLICRSTGGLSLKGNPGEDADYLFRQCNDDAVTVKLLVAHNQLDKGKGITK